MKILIVEDEPSLREILTRFLEKERYVVEIARTPRGAEQKTTNYDYECILLDVLDKSYGVVFVDGSKVEFDKKGEWKEPAFHF